MRHRLVVLRHVEEVTGNLAMACRYFGGTRPTYRNWLRRYEAEGVDGPHDRLKRPRGSPNTATRRGRREDRPPAPALPPRTSEDPDVPEAVPRRHPQQVRRVAHPHTPAHDPTPGLAAIRAARPTVEALRDKQRPEPSPPGRREVWSFVRNLPYCVKA
ncbi:helix-turn-helix domain-containing protein [Kutzneria buriramensis]|uniref:helix-turn-helix domain-containing protein n=1 Tax=Kutzneria buriramensis TaxID=1045776 RepID=UPI001476E0B7